MQTRVPHKKGRVREIASGELARLRENRKQQAAARKRLEASYVHQRVFTEVGAMCLAATTLMAVAMAYDYKVGGTSFKDIWDSRFFQISFPPGARADCALRSTILSRVNSPGREGDYWPDTWNVSQTGSIAAPTKQKGLAVWQSCVLRANLVIANNSDSATNVHNSGRVNATADELVVPIPIPQCFPREEQASMSWRVRVPEAPSVEEYFGMTDDEQGLEFDYTTCAAHGCLANTDPTTVYTAYLEPVFTPRFLNMFRRIVESRTGRVITNVTHSGLIKWFLPLAPCVNDAFTDNHLTMYLPHASQSGATPATVMARASRLRRLRILGQTNSTDEQAHSSAGTSGSSVHRVVPAEMANTLRLMFPELNTQAITRGPAVGASTHSKRAAAGAGSSVADDADQIHLGFCEDVAFKPLSTVAAVLQSKYFSFDNARVERVEWQKQPSASTPRSDRCTQVWSDKRLVAFESTTGRNYTFVFPASATAPTITTAAADIPTSHQCVSEALKHAAETVQIYTRAHSTHPCVNRAESDEPYMSFKWTREVHPAHTECPNRGTLFYDWSSTQCGQTAHATLLARVQDTYAPEVIISSPPGSPAPVTKVAVPSLGSASNLYHAVACHWPERREIRREVVPGRPDTPVYCLNAVLARLSRYLFRDNCGGVVAVQADYTNVKVFGCPGSPNERPRGPAGWPTFGCAEISLDLFMSTTGWNVGNDFCIDLSRYNPQYIWRITVPVSGMDSCGNVMPFQNTPAHKPRLVVSLVLADIIAGAHSAFIQSQFGCGA